MKAANVDQSRLLQQSTCYNKRHNWTFSVSWGYSVQIYDKIQSQSYLEKPIETFGEWRKGAWPPYMFNVRGFKNNNNNNNGNYSCGEVPNVLFFDSLEGTRLNHIVTTYVKKTPRSCAKNDHSSDGVIKIHVFSPMHKLHVGVSLLFTPSVSIYLSYFLFFLILFFFYKKCLLIFFFGILYICICVCV